MFIALYKVQTEKHTKKKKQESTGFGSNIENL